MALGAALVDKARIIRQQSIGFKVEGSTQYVDTEGAWFKARLELPSSPESETKVNRKRVTQKPTLLFKTKDLDGKVIEMRASDRVEVESHQLGTATWEVAGDPLPLRKRRALLGWQAELRRVNDEEAERV